MPLPRSASVVAGQPGFYHCISSCVRRSYLCGKNFETGEDFEHRRQWIVDRLFEITRVFTVDVYAYAIMHNHYHVVLHVDPTRARKWSDNEVAHRWSQVFSWRRKDRTPSTLPKKPTKELISIWRSRLTSLSWMMQSINEPIARWSNNEDDVTGHFWEGRFKSLPILDDAGMLTCMSYVDLNPVRAGIAIEPKDCDFTSVQQRINSIKRETEKPEQLGPMWSKNESQTHVGISTKQYIALLNATAANEAKKRKQTRAMLSNLGISADRWSDVVHQVTSLFRTAIGCKKEMAKFLKKTKRTRYRDATGRQLLYAQ